MNLQSEIGFRSPTAYSTLPTLSLYNSPSRSRVVRYFAIQIKYFNTIWPPLPAAELGSCDARLIRGLMSLKNGLRLSGVGSLDTVRDCFVYMTVGTRASRQMFM